jgi:hypothetical protein
MTEQKRENGTTKLENMPAKKEKKAGTSKECHECQEIAERGGERPCR